MKTVTIQLKLKIRFLLDYQQKLEKMDDFKTMLKWLETMGFRATNFPCEERVKFKIKVNQTFLDYECVFN